MTERAMTTAEATAALTAAGAPYELDTATVRGVEVRVWKHAAATLGEILERSLHHRERDFLVFEDERLTFGEHYALVATLAHHLSELGVRPGDRVAIAKRNLPEWVVSFWAAIAVGAVAVPLNAWWTGEELHYALEDCGAKVLCCDVERAQRVAPELPGLPQLEHLFVAQEDRGQELPAIDAAHAQLHDLAELLARTDPSQELPTVDVDTDADATIFYTSGTTGRPKGAVGTHRNALSNLMNLFFTGARSALRQPEPPEKKQPNAVLLSVPLFHATGCLAVMMSNLAAGGKIVLQRRFNAERALELIERERVTTFGGVPTIVMQILDSPAFAERDTSSVRSVRYGGAPCPPELVRRIRAAFPTGQPSNGYGMTETSAAAVTNDGEDYLRRPDSVGLPLPICDVAVVAEDFEGQTPDGGRLEVGQIGELWIKGPNVVRGYWNRPEETAKTFTAGWVHTGDLARMDDEGYIYIVDRSKDVIIRGGENVYSVVVEDVLHQHPAVADCAVIGVPHPLLGEEVGAVVVLRPGQKVRAEELATYVGQHLASFEVPRHLYLVEGPLPRNPAGKLLKRQLRDEVLSRAARD